MSRHSIPASASARRIATAPISMAVVSPNRPNGCNPTPMIATPSLASSTVVSYATGRNANVTTSLPSSSVRNGTTTSSMSIPMRSTSGSDSVRRDSTLTSSGSSTYPTPYGTKSLPPTPEYGGDGGGKFWVVHAHNRPRRDNNCSDISVDAQRGQEPWRGNVMMPHETHLLPMS